MDSSVSTTAPPVDLVGLLGMVITGLGLPSPVPELSFLPAPYREWTRAGERRVQDNLHAHAQNGAIFFPQIGEKPYLEELSNNFCIQIAQKHVN